MTRPLDHPLDEDEKTELATFLASRPDAMDPETLDGYFCALIANDARLRPAQWMPRALGDSELTWHDETQMERILALLLRKWNAVARGFQLDWQAVGEARMRNEMYLPDVALDREDAAPPLAARWARGFGAALALLPTAALARLEDDKEAMTTLSMIATLDAGQDERGEVLGHERRKQLVAHTLIGLQYLYRAARSTPAAPTPQRAAARPGRNDPCPCGSGVKFKKCCGSPARLH
ncbi:MAG: UPF0149 family protein [Rhodocyclaceae bacterium]|nr:UPF0149 family protein [Rhodocyclaceae bacterium]